MNALPSATNARWIISWLASAVLAQKRMWRRSYANSAASFIAVYVTGKPKNPVYRPRASSASVPSASKSSRP